MPNNTQRPLHLVLFFTQGVSLRKWDQLGLLDREVALYRRLGAAGVRVSFITHGRRGDLRYAGQLDGIDIHANTWCLPKAVYRRWVPWLHRRVLARCDVIKTNQTHGADIALRAARRWKKPLIARCGYMLSEVKGRERGLGSKRHREALDLERRVFTEADRVVVTSPAMADDVRRRLPEAFGNLRILPNYVDTDLFRPDPERKPEVDLVFVGRLSPEKNVEALLEAIRPLDIRLRIIGGSDVLPDWRLRYRDLGDRVDWLGNVPHTDLPHLIRGAKLYVLPSDYEGHPKALLEAMACGAPVIGADSAGIREVIQDGQNGLLCGTQPESIRRVVRELLADKALRRRLGLAAREYAMREVSLDRIVRREWDLLRELATHEPHSKAA